MLPLSKLAAAAATLAVLTACDPLRPRDAQERQTSQVAVAFDPADVGPLAERMKTLLVHVSKVEGDAVVQLESEQRLEVKQQQAEYVIKGVTLGMKEFKIFLLDDTDTALGEGSVRHLVKPGLNRTEPLIIKLKTIAQPLVDVSVELAISVPTEQTIDALVKKVILRYSTGASGLSGDLELARNAAGASLVSYEDLKPLLETRCVDCHSAENPLKKLELDKFPFVSGNIAEQPKLLEEIMKRIQYEPKPMPPKSVGGIMPADELQKFKDWQTGGFLAAPSAQAENVFRALLKQLKIADKVTGTLIVLGEGDVELHRADIQPFTVADGAVLKLAATIEVASPSVTIPIEVRPAE